jgi:hypothetical protein
VGCDQVLIEQVTPAGCGDALRAALDGEGAQPRAHLE